MSKAHLGSIKADDANFHDAQLDRADFQWASLSGCTFDNCVAGDVFAGYMLLGGLISILANKLARLS